MTAACDRAPDAAGKKPRCVLCGKCLSVCPLVAATGREELSPRAKFLLRDVAIDVPAASSPLDPAAAARLATLCLACGRCETVCPQGLCGPDLAARLRSEHPGWREFLWRQWLTRPETLWPAASALARLVPESLTGESGQAMLRQLTALSAPPAIRPWLRLASLRPIGQGLRAAIFEGCVARLARPSWADAARQIVTRLGYDFVPLDFACCGCSLGHAGLDDAKLEFQRHNKKIWQAAGKPLLVSFCATCRHGLRGYAQDDLDWSAADRGDWLARTASLAGLLLDAQAGFEERTGAANVLAPAEVFYHRPCHGAGHDQDRALLARALGSRLAKVGQDVCCGFGGVMQLGAPQLSRQVAARAWEFYAPQRPGTQVLSGCSACVVQLAATAPSGVLVGHWLEIMDV